MGRLLIQHLEHFPVWVIIFHLPRFPLVVSVCIQNCSLLPVLNSSSVYFYTDTRDIIFSPYPAVFMKMGKLYFIPSYICPLFWIQTHLRDISDGPVYNGCIFFSLISWMFPLTHKVYICLFYFILFRIYIFQLARVW